MREYMICLLILLLGTFAVSANAENGQTNATNEATTTSATVTVNITTSQNNQTTTILPETTTIIQGNITMNTTVALTTITPENVTNGNNTLNSTVTPNTTVTTSNLTTTTGVEISTNANNQVTSQSSTSETLPDVQTTASPPNTTELEPTTAQNTEATTQNTTETTADPGQTIVEKVKEKWAERVAETNFNTTALNETRILEITPSEVIDVIIDYYKTANQTQLQSFLESEKVSEIAGQILQQKPTVLKTYIIENFNATQNISLHGFLAALYWLDEEVLGVNQSFPILIARYGDDISSNEDNSTSENATTEGFIRFILSNASAVDLFGAICKAADGINDTICPTTAPPTVIVTPATLPGPEKFQSTWNDLVTASNYQFLSSEQKNELKSVTPESMTTALIDYVKNMDSTEIKKLVDANATIYVSSVLRSDGSVAVAILGQEAITAFGGDETREDVYYIYLNFMNNIFSQSGKFEIILRGYIEASSSSLARVTPTCDTSKITAPGLSCYTITTQAQNQTVLRDSICAELNGGSDCTSSFVVEEDNDEPTSQPVATGLSTGAIVGITLGAIAAFTLFFILIFLLWKRCNKKNSAINPENGDTYSDHMEMEGRRSSQTRPQVRSRTNGQLTSGDEPSTP